MPSNKPSHSSRIFPNEFLKRLYNSGSDLSSRALDIIWFKNSGQQGLENGSNKELENGSNQRSKKKSDPWTHTLDWNKATTVTEKGKNKPVKKRLVIENIATITQTTFNKKINTLSGCAISSYRSLDLSTKLGDGPIEAKFVLKNSDGSNPTLEEAKEHGLYFHASYDQDGNLTKLEYPKPPVKFLGESKDAAGYVEINGKIYTLPVNKGKFIEMTESLQKSQDKEARAPGSQETEAQETNIQNQEEKIPGPYYEVEETRIKTNFKKDKEFALEQAKKYIKNSLESTEPKRAEIGTDSPGGDKEAFKKKLENLLQKRIDQLLPTNEEPIEAKKEEMEEALNNAIHTAIETDQWNAAIKHLDELRDLRNNITRTEIIAENKDGHHPASVLIRDARNAKEGKLGTEAFKMQYLSALRSAEAIDVDSKVTKKTGKEVQDAFAKLDAAELNSSDQKQLQKLTFELINDDIVEPYEKAGIKDASTRINKAKDLLSLEDEQFNIVTLSKLNDATLVQAEVGLRDLTDQQIEEYSNVLDKDKTSPKWFTSLPDWHQTLVEKEINQILAGKILSSQCSYLPGLRNIFEKTTGVIDDKGAIKILNTVKHGGHMHAFSKDSRSNDNLGDMNAQQLQEWCGYDTSLHAVVLNSQFFLDPLDNKIVTSTREKASKNHWDMTHSPLNIFRKITSSDYSAAINLINYVEGKTNNEEIKKYLSGKSKYDKESLENALANYSQNDLAVLRSAIDLKKNIADLTYFDSNKNNLAIAACTANLVSSLDHAAKADSGSKFADFPSTAVFEACKSGKDRTGVVLLEITAKAVADELRISMADARNFVIATYHQQMLSGSPSNGGGSIGAFGTKPVPAPDNASELPLHSAFGNNIPRQSLLLRRRSRRLSTPPQLSTR